MGFVRMARAALCFKDRKIFRGSRAALSRVARALGVAAIAGAAAGWFLGPTVNRVLGWAFHLFNRGFVRSDDMRYTRARGRSASSESAHVVLVVYVGLLFLTWKDFQKTPKGLRAVAMTWATPW